MPSKLGPHFIGTPGFPRWLESGTTVFKFDPTSLGASGQVPPGPLVIGKLDQLEEHIDLTDWKHYMNAGGSPEDVAAHRFNVQRNIYVGAKKPRRSSPSAWWASGPNGTSRAPVWRMRFCATLAPVAKRRTYL